jgi:hypothetical protein
MSDDRPSAPMPQWPRDPKDAVAGPSDRPRHVQIATILMYAGAIVSVAAAVLAYFAPRGPLEDAAENALRQRKQAVTPEAVDALVSSTITTLIIIMLAAAVIWAMLGFFTSKRKNWARMVATVLGVLNVLATFLYFGPSAPALLLVVIGIAAVALLWTQTSRQWFGTSPRLKV